MSLIDVCSFGAKGDGTTDDSAVFQAAVDALRDSDGEIRLPSLRSPSKQENSDA
jgi:polygalacturonase